MGCGYILVVYGLAQIHSFEKRNKMYCLDKQIFRHEWYVYDPSFLDETLWNYLDPFIPFAFLLIDFMCACWRRRRRQISWIPQCKNGQIFDCCAKQLDRCARQRKEQLSSQLCDYSGCMCSCMRVWFCRLHLLSNLCRMLWSQPRQVLWMSWYL